MQDASYQSNGKSSSHFSLQPTKPAMQSIKQESAYSSNRYDRERRLSASSIDEQADLAEKRYKMSSGEPGRKMKTSTSYTSGLSIHPQMRSHLSGSDMYKNSFSEKRKQFESNAKENQPKTYSLGLYYPSKAKEGASNTDKQTVSSGSLYRRSVENILQANDSQENIARSATPRPQGRVIPLEHKSPSRKSHQSNYSTSINLSSSPSRHSFPDSSSPLSSQITNFSPPESRVSETPRRSEHHSLRHHIPVVSQSAMPPNMSASVDNINTQMSQYYEQDMRSNLNNSRGYEQQNQGPGGRTTFIVKIGDKTLDTSNGSGQNSGDHAPQTGNYGPTYGPAFALYKSPVTQIEIKQNDRQGVAQRKQQFEHGSGGGGGGKISARDPANRYKSEIKKITTQGKFTSVENRMRKFEKNPDGSIKIRRMSSTDSARYSSPEPSSGSGQSSRSQSEQRNSQHSYQESAPIRIYVSQGSSNNQSSPIVEILPMSSYQHQEERMGHQRQSSQDRMSSAHSLEDMVDGHHDNLSIGEGHGHKVQRKDSFLAAVTSQQQQKCKH